MSKSKSAEESPTFTGYITGMPTGGYELAQEMRVLVCALVTAHKREDAAAFWSTVEITKTTLAKYANFSTYEWAVFRNDTAKPPKDE